MGIEYFCCYHSYLEVMEQLNDAEKGRLFTACLMWQNSTGRCAGKGGIDIGKMGSQKKRKSLCRRANFHQAGRSDSQANEQGRIYPVH